MALHSHPFLVWCCIPLLVGVGFSLSLVGGAASPSSSFWVVLPSSQRKKKAPPERTRRESSTTLKKDGGRKGKQQHHMFSRNKEGEKSLENAFALSLIGK